MEAPKRLARTSTRELVAPGCVECRTLPRFARWCALEVRDYWRRGLRIPYPPPLLLRHADEYLAPSPPRVGRGGTGRVARLRRFATGDHRTRICSGSEPADQPLPAGLNFGEGQARRRRSRGETNAMRPTNDQQNATEALRTQAGPYRVTLDPEGWPRIEGRYGQIERQDGVLLAVDSQAVRKLAPLVALGARRHQIGDDEYRLLFDPVLLGDVAVFSTCYTAPRGRTKSMKPCSTSLWMSWTRARSPTSRPSKPRTTFPSTGGWRMRTHVPFSDAPVTIASNRSPIRDARSCAAADFRTCRSTLAALSSCSVQWRANAFSSASLYGTGRSAIAALSSRCVTRSGKRRLGAVEWV